MLKTRIAPALALAAAVALGTTGCGLIVPQATTYEYAPSDGIDIDLPGVDIRNFMLVAGPSSANLVFTGVNNGDSDERVTFNIVEEGDQSAKKVLTVEPGTTAFGVDEEQLIELELKAGSMITAFVEHGGTEIERQVPVVDGSLKEYTDLVPSSDLIDDEDTNASDDEDEDN